MVTFGKAVGVSGAAVLCAAPVAEYQLQFARHLIYSTTPPPAQIAAIDAALTIVRRGDALRQRLWDSIARFRRGGAALGFALAPSDTAIQPLVIGDNLRTLQLAEHLRERGVWLTAIRPPTVPPGCALRLPPPTRPAISIRCWRRYPMHNRRFDPPADHKQGIARCFSRAAPRRITTATPRFNAPAAIAFAP